MSEPSAQDRVRHIEAAIEAGRLAEARSALGQAVAALGNTPELDQLDQRLREIEAIALPEELANLLSHAQSEVQRASYDTALEALRRAAALRPGDPTIEARLEQTERAAERHAAALGRSQAAQEAAETIGFLLDQGDLEGARVRLREAGVTHGRHAVFDNLGQRLVELESQAKRRHREELLARCRQLFEAGNWRGVLQEAERLLRLDPESADARELWTRARAEVEKLESRRQRDQALETAQGDVERLIAAGELVSANHRLQTAIQELGREDVFVELGKQLDRARSDLKFRQRVEWAERRANEAERLLQEAQRLTLQGSLAEAAQSLERAQSLDPSHPEIPDRLAAAYGALDRQDTERQRAEAVTGRIQTMSQMLDALRLTEAEALLQRTRDELGPDDRLFPLAQRLARLRRGERASAELARIGSPETGPQRTAELLRSQQESWAAYSWKQALRFPLRDHGTAVLLVVAIALASLDALTYLPRWPGAISGGLRLGLLALLLVLGAVVTRSGVRGDNHLPAWGRFLGGDPWRDGGWRMAVALLVAVVPLAAWVATARWHGLLSQVVGWWVLAALAWGACAVVVLALGIGSTFGGSRFLRFAGHAKVLARSPRRLMLVIGCCFGGLVAWGLLRALLLPLHPWSVIPALALAEAYCLLALPHIVAVAMRREGADLAPIYT